VISRVGGIDLDLTEATAPDEGAKVVKAPFVTGAKLRVPADLNVGVEGWNLLGVGRATPVPRCLQRAARRLQNLGRRQGGGRSSGLALRPVPLDRRDDLGPQPRGKR
jgi:hypothetical protein